MKEKHLILEVFIHILIHFCGIHSFVRSPSTGSASCYLQITKQYALFEETVEWKSSPRLLTESMGIVEIVLAVG